jgi:hypothetical protein
MKFVPDSLSRKMAGQALLARKHSPEILLVAGITSMVSSTVLACRATLKLESVLDEIGLLPGQRFSSVPGSVAVSLIFSSTDS